MSNNNDIITVGVDKYDIQEEFINKIASKYFDVDNINKLKVGLFGYVNEVLATETRNGIQHRNFLYDEAFLNTASMTKSIYNKAKSYNYEIPLAKPAKMLIAMTFYENDLLAVKESVDGDNTKFMFRISNDNTFIVGDYKFMLENDIIIYIYRSKSQTTGLDEYTYVAQYDFSNNPDNCSTLDKTLTTPYLKLWIDHDSRSGNIISIQTQIWQMEKKETIFENYSSDLSDMLFFDVPFTNQLCKFTVNYKINKEEIMLKSYFNDTFVPEDEFYHFYSYSANNLNLYFSALPNSFKPAINSKLIVTTYSTMGLSGNFSFFGDVIFKFKDNNLSKKVRVAATKISNPAGGNNSPSMKEIKQYLIKQFLARDNLITELDLNSYFNSLIKSEVVNSSEILFIKRRDDVLCRLFSVFMLLRDKTGLIVPTNTIDIDVTAPLNEDYYLNAGSKILYNEYKYIVIPANDENDYSDYIVMTYPDDPYRYILITEHVDLSLFEGYEIITKNMYETILSEKHYIVIPENYDKEELDLSKYKVTQFDNDTNYYILIDDTINMDDFVEYQKITKAVTNNVYNQHNLETTIYDDSIVYRLPFSLIYKREPFQRLLAVNNTLNNEIISFKYEYINSNISKEFLINYLTINRDPIDTNNETNTNKYHLELTIDSSIINQEIEVLRDILKVRCMLKDKNGEYTGYFDFDLENKNKLIFIKELETNNKITNDDRLCLINSDIYDIHSHKKFEEFYINDSIDFDIILFYKDNNPEITGHTAVTSKMKDVKDYSLAIQFKNSKKLKLFTILNNVMHPVLEFKGSHFSKEGFYVKHIPVLGYHYTLDYSVYKDFFRTFKIYYDILIDNFNKLENNTTLDIKFYNTYGYSRQFSSNTTHIKLSLIIKLVDSYTKSLDFKIKNFIIEFLEKVNNTTSKVFAISNLLRELENNFDDIQYIELISIDDSKNQKVYKDYPELSELTKEQLINYVPEYLNIYIGSESYKGNPEYFDVGINIQYK